MAGFRKAKAEQAAIKLGMYGPPGSGKTFTALLAAEGLAKLSGKRIAFIDTERGTDFYCQAVKDRTVHPEAFDFDALYSRSITDILDSIRNLPDTYGVVVLDSISHVWDAAIAAYKGKRTKIDTIPMNAWGEIKRPYKELMALLLSMPIHAIICGRQKNEFGEDADGDLKKIGVAMRAEGETQYEPHITIRMEASKVNKSDILANVEKDRTGILQGKVLVNPTFDSLIKPIIPLLGTVQAKMETEDETAAHDAETMASEESKKNAESERLFARHKAALEVAATDGKAALEKAAKEITAADKKRMLAGHVTQLRELYNALAQRA